MNTITHSRMTSSKPALVAAALPLLFILLWSTGYAAGKLGLASTGPLTLLSLRFALAALVLLSAAVFTGAPWPRTWRAWGHLAVTGLLIQGLHFVGIYGAVHLGLSAGVAALLIGLMPLATALGGHLWLSERMTRRQLWSLSGGLAGVLLVVLSKPLHAAALAAYGAALLGLCGLVLGTLYQKRFCADMDLRSGAGIQMASAAVMVSLLAWPVEHFAVNWNAEFIATLLWIVFVNSIGAFSLMFVMLRRGQASQVARLFFLVPGVSALIGFVLLGEQLSLLAMAGFVIAALAVSRSAP